MDATARGVAEEKDDEQRIHQQDIFDGVVFFLAAITLGLCRRVLGADDTPLRPVMGKRGDGGTTADAAARGAASSSDATTAAASASATPSRWARAVRRSEERRVGKESRSRWSPYH